ncbi:hypothetical protein SGLAM104S_09129 [Streptomyces glaucescens]
MAHRGEGRTAPRYAQAVTGTKELSWRNRSVPSEGSTRSWWP